MDTRWLYPKDIQEATKAQAEMRECILLKDTLLETPQTIAGMDVSNTLFDPKKLIFGASVVLSSSLEMIEIKTKMATQKFPYIPGFLGFREAPVLVEAYNQLSLKPDIIMVDGHGISHPRGLGVASHLGVLLDIPTIGVAKSILVGQPKGPLLQDVGSMTPLVFKNKEIGMLIRTKKNCSPLIISAGHKITLELALKLVFSSLKKYRLPEPTRQAHLTANACRKSHL